MWGSSGELADSGPTSGLCHCHTPHSTCAPSSTEYIQCCKYCQYNGEGKQSPPPERRSPSAGRDACSRGQRRPLSAPEHSFQDYCHLGYLYLAATAHSAAARTLPRSCIELVARRGIAATRCTACHAAAALTAWFGTNHWLPARYRQSRYGQSSDKKNRLHNCVL